MLFLNCDGDYVRYFLHVAHRNSILSLKYHASYGTHLLHNLEESVGGRSIALSRMITEKEYRF